MTCGSRYGWSKYGYSNVGVGVAKSLFAGDEIRIILDHKKKPQDVFIVDTAKAKKFIADTKSYEHIRGVLVGYIPRDMLTQIT